jgi:type IV fimbrial biogenesis protein FimT
MNDSKYEPKIYFNGFTIVELMVVLALVGIISSIAIPSYQSMIFRNRVETAVSSLHGALLLARSEALKRGVPVTICRSETANTAPTCAASNSSPGVNTGWADGWIIFVDNNNNGQYNPGAVPSELLINAQGRLSRDITDISIIPNVARKFITFGPTGQVFGVFIQLAVNRPDADSDISHDRYICIASGGRARVSNDPC